MSRVALATRPLRECRDLRLGGRWSATQRARNLLLRGLIVLALGLVDRLPERVVRALGPVLGRMAHALRRRDAARAEAQVRRFLPGVDARAVVREAFVNAGANLGLCLLLRRSTVRALDWVTVPPGSLATLREALAPGRGALFVSAHLGPFELIPAAVRELGFPVSIIVRESYDPSLDRHVDAHRRARGLDVIHRGHPGAPARVLRALRRGHPVGVLPDLGARVPSRRVPFLAGEALLPTGPARLAARLDVPVVVGTLHPCGPRRFELRIETVPGGSESDLLERLTGVLGQRVAAAPGQWLWMGAKSLVIADSTPPALDSWAIQRTG
jgi:Kdo2-lipid IVA lauroyltransferase/acyltransferase